MTTWAYGNVSRAVERLDAQNTALIQEVVGYLNDQFRSQNTGPSKAGATPMTRSQKTHHRGTRFVLTALWLWWLLFAIPIGIGIILGVYSLFTRS
jgi:hypothetical protein